MTYDFAYTTFYLWGLRLNICFRNMDLSVEREVTKVKWQDISQNYSVPKSLFDHQTDTITLLLHGEHVFCGSPTGSGKTLAQLCTVLFTSGNSNKDS